MDSDFLGPVNIGSEMVTIGQLVDTAARVSKKVEKNYIDGPTGVRGRNSNNDLIRENLVGITVRPLRVSERHITSLRFMLVIR